MRFPPNFRYLLYRFKYRYGRRLPIRKPVDVSLELSSRCSFNCAYCYHADPNNLPFTRGFMAPATANKILNQAANLGVNSLKMNWKGESTLNPNFKLITKKAKDLASGSTFIDRITNSNFWFPTDRDDIFDGLCNQTKVKVSFDSFIKEVFETQRAGGNYDTVLANIDKFYNYPKRRKTALVIQSVRTTLNKDEDFLNIAQQRWPEAVVSIRDMVSGRVGIDVSALEHRHRTRDKRQSCLQAHVRLIFSWDGRAFPCCPDIAEQLCLGNINDTTMRDIFRSGEARQLRRSLLSGKAFENDPCKNCSSFESYAGYRPNWVS